MLLVVDACVLVSSPMVLYGEIESEKWIESERLRDVFGMSSECLRNVFEMSSDAFGMPSGCFRDAFGMLSGLLYGIVFVNLKRRIRFSGFLMTF